MSPSSGRESVEAPKFSDVSRMRPMSRDTRIQSCQFFRPVLFSSSRRNRTRVLFDRRCIYIRVWVCGEHKSARVKKWRFCVAGFNAPDWAERARNAAAAAAASFWISWSSAVRSDRHRISIRHTVKTSAAAGETLWSSLRNQTRSCLYYSSVCLLRMLFVSVWHSTYVTLTFFKASLMSSHTFMCLLSFFC